MRPIEGVARIIPRDLDADLLLARLDAVPRRVVDDAEMRDVGHFPLGRCVRAGDASAGARVLGVGAAVPFEPADIERVVEDAGAAVHLTADGRIAPGPTARTGNALGVERPGDRARAAAVGERAEERKMRRTIAASASLMRRSPAPPFFAPGSMTS